MAKKGQLVFIAIITLVVALFAGIMYPNIAKAYSSGEVALKAATAKDMALILDAMYSYPNDMEIEYDVDLSKFIVQFTKNKVEVRKGNSDPSLGEYNFVSVDNDDPSVTLYGPKKIIFRKENSHIIITSAS